jgi:ABC-2 type transport system ATP-binding protein
VKKLNKMGCTIIYTTHYMEEVEEICTKIAIMDHGKVIAEGTNDELKLIITDRNTVAITVDNASKIMEEQLLKIIGVQSVETYDNVVKINSFKEINNLDKIILYFTTNNIRIKNVESKVPDLETVFLTLTGRKLRD